MNELRQVAKNTDNTTLGIALISWPTVTSNKFRRILNLIRIQQHSNYTNNFHLFPLNVPNIFRSKMLTIS